MLDKKFYANGQEVFDLDSHTLTYFFKDGSIKALGPFKDGNMEGEWKFYRATGQLWAVGSFLNNRKHGIWTRYNRDNQIEYQVSFIDGKEDKKII